MSKRAINPASLAPPVGFAHGWLVEHGGLATLYLAGQCGHDGEGRITAPGDLVGQMAQALANVGAVLEAAGMGYTDLVQLNLYVTSRDAYAVARKDFGRVWKSFCGKHFPAMAIFGVGALLDPQARIEIQGIAATAR